MGACVGISDKQNSHLTYKLSTRNLIVGIFLIETIIVPIIVPIVVANDEFYCPVASSVDTAAGAQ